MAEKENEIEQYESFDVVNDLYLPIKEQEENTHHQYLQDLEKTK